MQGFRARLQVDDTVGISFVIPMRGIREKNCPRVTGLEPTIWRVLASRQFLIPRYLIESIDSIV